MKTIMHLAVALIAMAVFDTTAADSNIRKEIEAAEKKWTETLNRHDLAGLMRLYTADAQSLNPDSGILKGRDAIEAHWKKALEAVKDDGRIETSTTLDVIAHGEFATETGIWESSRPGGREKGGGTYVMVWKKEGGTWKVYRETWNESKKYENPTEVPEALAKVIAEYAGNFTKQDAAVFERLLHEEYSLCQPEGKLLTKAQVVENARSGKVKFEVGEILSSTVRVYGDIAIERARWKEKGVEDGKPFGGTLRYTAIYRKSDDGWKVLSDHATTIKEE